MKHTLRQAAGSLLVVGLEGSELSALERAWLRIVRPSGIILFRRNIVDAHQTRALRADATHLCATPSLRCVDLEGGLVDRLRDALAPIPSARSVADAASSTNNDALIREHGTLIARAVKAFGFNTTLAPVLDLALPESAKVLDSRAVSSTHEGVIRYAKTFLTALSEEGVVGCGKHFPGLGAGSVDSHALTPSIERSMRELRKHDLAPYRELASVLPMIMVNHAAYPQTPSKHRPATVSPFWITTVLRKQLDYRGLAFSDDLEMGGILNHMSIEEASIAGVRAGLDLLEICRNPELILRAFEALLSEAERSASFRKILLERALHSHQLRKKYFAASAPRALSNPQLSSLHQRIQRFREQIERTSEKHS